jgi:DNA polymerase III subunit delta
MNVRPDQLAAVIAKTAYPVYMVSGDEPLQQMESLDLIRAFLRKKEYSEREVLDVDAQFDWQRLMDEANSLSLFASRRIVELRLPSAKPGKQGAQVIKEYLTRPPEDTVLIINAGKIDGNSKKSAWFKAVDQNGLVVQCWPVPLDKLSFWLRQRFKARDMDADAEVLSYISQHVEGNLLAADQEIEKLFMLLGPGKITYADVAQAVTSQSRYSVFELLDVLLSGDVKRVVKIISGLKAEAVVPVIINWALAKDIRLLAQVSQDPTSADFVLKRSGVWQSRVNLFKSCMSRHSQRAFHLMLKRCSYIDAVSKGMIDANVWDEIESLCVRLAGTSRRTG